MNINPRWLFLLFLGCYPIFLLASEAADTSGFIRIQARSGDGIYSLLRRYELDQHSCNFDQFYSLNELKKNAALIQGRTYLLPIYRYTFNGRTIRSTIGVDDWDLAVTIQSYNERMYEQGLRPDDFRNDLKLWVPYHLLKCGDSDLEIAPPQPIADPDFEDASNPSGRVFPIFGSTYAKTPKLSDRLAGRIFYVVAGHGGPDPGAIGKRSTNILCEDEYAYDVALRLCRKLIEHGATAYMIVRDEDDGIRSGHHLNCDEDEIVWGGPAIPRSQKGRLFQRSDIINALYEKNRTLGFTDQTTIVIHVDSRARKERTDLFFYYQYGQQASKELAGKLHKVMKNKYAQYRANGQYHGTVSTRDLHMLREVNPTTVYVELANIRNTHDQQRIILESNRQALANWLYEGLLSN
jgi:N-acetylmuramoyl-L-alanine amidase